MGPMRLPISSCISVHCVRCELHSFLATHASNIFQRMSQHTKVSSRSSLPRTATILGCFIASHCCKGSILPILLFVISFFSARQVLLSSGKHTYQDTLTETNRRTERNDCLRGSYVSACEK